MSKEKWINFPNVANQTEGLITVGYTGMPMGFDAGSLQLNVDAMQRAVIAWGGFAAVSLSAYHGDSDRVDYYSDGYPARQPYSVGAMISERAESGRMMTEGHRSGDSSVLCVQWNMGSLNSHLEISDQYDATVRATQLNSVIRKQAINGVLGRIFNLSSTTSSVRPIHAVKASGILVASCLVRPTPVS